MFVSTRDQGRRRRSYISGVNKSAWSSKLSLLSAVTASSNGSSGSTSTITQESYTRSRNESTRRRKPSKRKKDIMRPHPPRMQSDEKPAEDGDKVDKGIDVFTYLIDDAAEKPKPSTEHRTPPHVEESPPDDGYDYSTRSQHSDSGISMDDVSCVIPRALQPKHTVLPPLAEIVMHDGTTDEVMPRYQPDWKWPDVPKPTPLMLPPYVHQYSMDSSFQRNDSHLGETIPGPNPFQQSKPELSGYDLVATRLVGANVQPIFKRFGKVNYRILLVLQDEIAEMEDELAQLDMADTRSRHRQDGSTTPASRRVSWQFVQSDIHARRLELLGRLYIKIEQYYQALIATQKITRLCGKPASRDIEQFRIWLKENRPISVLESRFLDDDNDLLSLQASDPQIPLGKQQQFLLAICISLTAILPLLFFKVVANHINRLIFVAFMASVTACVLERLGERNQRQIQQWIMACTGVSIIAAVLF